MYFTTELLFVSDLSAVFLSFLLTVRMYLVNTINQTDCIVGFVAEHTDKG